MTRSWSARSSLFFSDALSYFKVSALFLWSHRSVSIEKGEHFTFTDYSFSMRMG
jgi:hypothetical protein